VNNINGGKSFSSVNQTKEDATITRLAVLLLLPVMALSVARAQTVTRISEEGTFEALGVEVKFNSPVINLKRGFSTPHLMISVKSMVISETSSNSWRQGMASLT
jgi:hypothetical protein